MPCYKERHPLLLDCFIPFLKYIRVVGRATGSIDESLMVHNMSAFLPITNIKFHANLRFWAPSQHRTGTVLLCYRERYLLLIKCFITFLRCVKMAERASGIIYEPIMVHNVSFLPTTNLKFHAKFQFSGTLPAKGIWCLATRRDIHCSLSGLKPSLDIWESSEKLLTASTSPL